VPRVALEIDSVRRPELLVLVPVAHEDEALSVMIVALLLPPVSWCLSPGRLLGQEFEHAKRYGVGLC
jgi:hypothetical protein